MGLVKVDRFASVEQNLKKSFDSSVIFELFSLPSSLRLGLFIL